MAPKTLKASRCTYAQLPYNELNQALYIPSPQSPATRGTKKFCQLRMMSRWSSVGVSTDAVPGEISTAFGRILVQSEFLSAVYIRQVVAGVGKRGFRAQDGTTRGIRNKLW